jgi:parallel beta-helix repeat protein
MPKTPSILAASLIARSVLLAMPAWAVTLPATQTTITTAGSYTLSADRFSPVTIASGGVTLDCAGHGIYAGPLPISAPLKAQDSGENGITISTPGFWTGNTVIRNCVVKGWDTGISGNYIDTMTITNTTMAFNWDGLDINYSERLTVTGSSSLNNSDDGFDFDFLDDATITNNTVDHNADHGISLNNHKQGCSQPWRNSRNTLSSNTITSNGGSGINVKVTQDSFIKNNLISLNAGAVFGTGDTCSSNNMSCGNHGCAPNGGPCWTETACH